LSFCCCCCCWYQGKAAAKAAVPKAAAGKASRPLAPSTAHNVHGGKAIEEIYQKKSQLEHILLRPDTYIGSTEKQQQTLWVHDGQSLVFKNITFAPGLFKIFDEILVNAADNKVRDATMDMLKVDILPVSMHLMWGNLQWLPTASSRDHRHFHTCHIALMCSGRRARCV